MAVKTLLRKIIPEWADFKIAACGKYLGFQCGPSAGGIQWNAPLQKFKNRVKEINTPHAAISISAYTYNVRAVPVLINIT